MKTIPHFSLKGDTKSRQGKALEQVLRSSFPTAANPDLSSLGSDLGRHTTALKVLAQA